MPEHPFTLLDDGRPMDAAVQLEGGRIWLPAATLERLGWHLEPEGLCREGLCLPLPPGGDVGPDGIALDALAALLDRPLALDAAEGVAYLGRSAVERAGALASLEAPDFTLPDLSGRLHALSAHRGKKVFLVAYASW